MHKSVYLGAGILEISKIVMAEFWYNYMILKYREKTNLGYTYSFTVYIKIKYIQVDIAKDVKTRFETKNYESDKPLLNGKNIKVTGSMNDELGRKIKSLLH